MKIQRLYILINYKIMTLNYLETKVLDIYVIYVQVVDKNLAYTFIFDLLDSRLVMHR